ncbi:hypothetical protein BGZ60DRAFT_429004 [Tricladium varicosporioides]|nr:hypothetical protein BGZ60DRAFT_429004 [Hymenoscyphus varicosporioides]
MASQTCAVIASDDSLGTNPNEVEDSNVPLKQESNDSKELLAKQAFANMYTSEQQQQLFQQKLEEQRFRTQLMREEFEAEQIRLDELHKLKLANERRLAEEKIFELKDARLKEEKRLDELHQTQLHNERNRGQQALYNLQAADRRVVTHENELHMLKKDATKMNLDYDSNPMASTSTSNAGVNRSGDDSDSGTWGTIKNKKKNTLSPAIKSLTETPNPLKTPASDPSPLCIPGWWRCNTCNTHFDPQKEMSKRFCPNCGFRKGVANSYTVL